MTEYCAVIGHALYRVGQQTAVKEVTRPLPSLAERGVATQDSCLTCVSVQCAVLLVVKIKTANLCSFFELSLNITLRKKLFLTHRLIYKLIDILGNIQI